MGPGRAVDFFWSGPHWLRSAILYLPVQEGGQGLVDIAARIAAFRLQTVQRWLYRFGLPWMDTACLLLRRAGRLGYDKHLFLLRPQSKDLTGLTPFYQSVVQAWQVFTYHREAVMTPGMWLFEEPLFGNNFITNIRSIRLLRRLVEEVCASLPEVLRKFAEDRIISAQWDDEYECLSFPDCLSCCGTVAG